MIPRRALLYLAPVPLLLGEETTNFRQTRWGMSQTEVIALEGPPKTRKPEELTYDVTVVGKKATLGFDFVTDKLANAGYLLQETYVEPNQYVDASQSWVETVTEKYGTPKNKTGWSNDLFRNEPKKLGLAISLGHVITMNTWDLPDTRIEHYLLGGNYKVTVAVMFRSKEFEAAFQRQKREANKKAF
jgi:hypothetical protein